MAKREVIDCDICKSKDCNDIENFKFNIGRVNDAAGGMENVYQEFDVCKNCQTYWLKNLLLYMEKTGEVDIDIAESILIKLRDNINEKS